MYIFCDSHAYAESTGVHCTLYENILCGFRYVCTASMINNARMCMCVGLPRGSYHIMSLCKILDVRFCTTEEGPIARLGQNVLSVLNSLLHALYAQAFANNERQF